jgi:hypothetical protein
LQVNLYRLQRFLEYYTPSFEQGRKGIAGRPMNRKGSNQFGFDGINSGLSALKPLMQLYLVTQSYILRLENGFLSFDITVRSRKTPDRLLVKD